MKLPKNSISTNRRGAVDPKQTGGEDAGRIQDGKTVSKTGTSTPTKAQISTTGFPNSGFETTNASASALRLVDGGAKKNASLSKSAQASVAGLDAADGKSPAKSNWFKRGVMGVMAGMMLANATAPVMAQDALTFNLNSPQGQSELVVDSANAFGTNAFGANASEFGLGSTTISPWQTRLAFDAAPSADADLSPAVQQAVDQAFDRFENRIQDALTPGGLDLAKQAGGGEVGFNLDTRQGDVTEAQADAVKDALQDLFKDLPVAAYSEGMADKLTAFFTARGVPASELDAATLSDFGSAGGDVAKQMVEDFRDDRPVAFYSLASVLAGGAGAAAYFQGSDALESIGLRPEVSTKLFDNTRVKVGASWDEKFSNPSLELSARNVLDFDSAYSLTTEGRAYFGGESFGDLDLDAWRLSSTFHADDGHMGIRVYAQDADSAMHGIAQGFQVGTNAWYRSDDFRITGGADYNAFTDAFNARLSAEYEPSENVSIGLHGSHSSHGDSVISIGAAIRF